MEEAPFQLNWLACGLAALVPLVVGFVWYNPKVFGTAWMNSLNYTEEDLKGANMPLIFILALVFAFMTTIPMTVIVSHGGAEFMTFKHGALHGALISVFMVLPIIGTNALFERRSFKYIGIHLGYWMISFAIMGGILCMMRLI